MATAIFSTTGKPLSRFIRWGENSPISHCALGFQAEGVPLILEASFFGVKPSLRREWMRHNRIVEEYDSPNANVKNALECLGEAYGFAELVGMGIVVAMARWLHRSVRNPLSSPKTRICSELLVLALNREKGLENLDPETRPEPLRAACARHLTMLR